MILRLSTQWVTIRHFLHIICFNMANYINIIPYSCHDGTYSKLTNHKYYQQPLNLWWETEWMQVGDLSPISRTQRLSCITINWAGDRAQVRYQLWSMGLQHSRCTQTRYSCVSTKYVPKIIFQKKKLGTLFGYTWVLLGYQYVPTTLLHRHFWLIVCVSDKER
jgi:hypothetical protein